MRKQYHFRKVAKDTWIWDVDQLIHESANFPVIKILLDDIQELNEFYWFPNQFPTTLQLIEHFKLVEDAELSYPIIICPEGRIMDGMHRVAKARMLNLSTIQAVQFKDMPHPDFINVDEDDLNYD